MELSSDESELLSELESALESWELCCSACWLLEKAVESVGIMSETTMRTAKMMMTTLAGVERLLAGVDWPFLVAEPLPLAEDAPVAVPFLAAFLLGFFDMPERSLRVHMRLASPGIGPCHVHWRHWRRHRL